ncbi:MAG: hypothetical protein SPK32_00015 [Bacteroidaceae bacterium]|nr:hypothetical protein [Bacteroidaceae bacterium]
MPTYHNRVPIALPTSLHRGGLSNVSNTVNLILSAIFPGNLSREHYAIISEVCIDSHIYF